MRTSDIFVVKTEDFAKIIVYPNTQGRQCGHFTDKGKEGSIFVTLCGCLIWTASYVTLLTVSLRP